MRRIILVLALLLALPARASIRFVSESGGLFTGGSFCNGQTAISRSTFNGITNSVGDVNYMCGTLAGSVTPIGNGSGSGVNSIQINFDIGASITVSACGSSGCLNLSGRSWYVVSGVTVGSTCGWSGLSATTCPYTIVATGNGTGSGSGESLGINLTGNASHITIQKMGIENMYVHTGSGNDLPAGNYYAISIVGTGDSILNNTIHDAGAGVVMNVTSSSITIQNNEIYNCNWSVFGSGSTTVNGITTIIVSNNGFHDWQNWDTTSDGFHHDGAFFAGNNNSANTVSGVDIYDNYFYGTISDPTVCATASNSCMTALVYVNDTNHVRTYNNVLIPNLF